MTLANFAVNPPPAVTNVNLLPTFRWKPPSEISCNVPPTVAWPVKRFPGIAGASNRALFAALSLFVATSTPVLAVNAVWLLSPGSGIWNVGTNWSMSSAPVNPGDTATFNTSIQTSLTLSAPATVESITFNPGASAFTINTSGNVLTVQGVGIVNNSGQTLRLINSGAGLFGFTPGGSTEFHNTSSAGNATITNHGGQAFAGGGFTQFLNTSSAGRATITNRGGEDLVGGGGFTQFLNTSSAGHATITNNGGEAHAAGGGHTQFLNTSSAGHATITNNGGGEAGGGLTEFFNTSTAGSATITNNGGSTGFSNTSSAGHATIVNNDGFTEFFNASTAGSATITNESGGTFFLDSSDGGTARAITNGNGVLDISGLTTPGITIGSIEGSGNYFLGSKMLIVGGNNLSTTVSGVVQDGGIMGGTGGSLIKVGTGTLTLSGANTYTGTTTVNGGSLIVDGSIESAQTFVNPGGLLGGRGSLGGSLVNSAIVSPGDFPGRLTVSGTYTQNGNGTLRIEVAGLAPNQHDLLAIGGHASLNGTLQLIPLGGFKLQVGDKATFLTANGGVSGTFSAIQNEFATVVKTQIIILPTAVVLEGTQGSFVPAACNPNSAAVAHALDSAVGDPRAAGLINFLDSEPLDKLCPDFTLIAPEELTSVYSVTVSLANVQTANLERRMDDIRAGSTGFNAAGFTMNGITPSFSGGLGGPTGPEGKSGPSVVTPIPENRWGVFATGVGEFTHVDSTGNVSGFDLQTGGVTLGVDYRVCSNFAIGLIAGYAHTNADLANNGNLDVNSGTFGIYATAFSGGFYLDSALTGGISEYDSHRTALLGTASGSTDGGYLNVLINGGYDWRKGGLSIGPTASFQYTYVSFDGFTESGSLAPLKFNDQHVDSIRTAIGMKASYDWKVGHILVRPELRAAWQHEYGNSAYSIAASFANGAGTSFTVSGPKIGRDSLLLGAGVAILWSDRISTYIYYDGDLSRTNYDSNNVSAGVRITF
jgi:outer membrane autotransporter protein